MNTPRLSPSCEGAPAPAEVARVVSGSDLIASFQTFLDSAEAGDTVRIMSPVIDDPVAVACIRDARRRGVVIAILTTLVDRHGIKTKGWDNSQNIEKHGECIRDLARCGCMLRSPDTTPHGKMMLADRGTVWFGSANLAINALHGHSTEAVIDAASPELASRLTLCFEAVWKASRYRMTHRQGAVFLEETGASPLKFVEPSDASGLDVWCSAPGVPLALQGIMRVFAKAEKAIVLLAMSVYELDQVPELHDVLKSALRRGVAVKALIRKEQFEQEERRGDYPDPATLELIACGMKLVRVQGLHAKGFLVDDRRCGILSANFNPYSLDWRRAECNIELVVAADIQHPLLMRYARWMRDLAVQSDAP